MNTVIHDLYVPKDDPRPASCNPGLVTLFHISSNSVGCGKPSLVCMIIIIHDLPYMHVIRMIHDLQLQSKPGHALANPEQLAWAENIYRYLPAPHSVSNFPICSSKNIVNPRGQKKWNTKSTSTSNLNTRAMSYVCKKLRMCDEHTCLVYIYRYQGTYVYCC